MEFCSYTTILDNLIAEKKIKPLIAIFIDYLEGDVDYFLNKTNEYISVICEELLPLIEKNYRVSTLPEDRVLSGISAGGHITLLTVLRRPDVFLNAAGQSVTTTDELFNAVKEIPVSNNLKELKFYFDVGRYDLISGSSHGSFLYSNQQLHKQMTKSGLNHTFKVVNDGHQWASWRERTDDILIYFFGLNNDNL